MENVPVVNTLLRLYEEGKATRDPRTRHWPLLWDNPVYVWVITATYLTFVVAGKRIMKNRKPFEMPNFMIVYNLGLVFLSVYMFIEILLSSYDLGYFKQPLCAPYNSETAKNPKELRLANVLWWYFFSKVIEFTDTILMILRKKFDQVTFLHVYHHASMLNIWWWVTTYIPGGQSWFSSSLNCSVHIVMYSYYGLAAIPSLRHKLWWKKYITRFQLLQFILTLFHTLQTTFSTCEFPMWSQHLLTWYMVSMLILFGNFYLQTYIRKKNRHKANGVNGTVTNGVVPESAPTTAILLGNVTSNKTPTQNKSKEKSPMKTQANNNDNSTK